MEFGQGLNLVLSRAFGVQGAPAPFMASEIFPMVVLGNDRPEWGFLQNCRYAQGRGLDAANAGDTSHVGLQNPVGSGAIMVIERIMMANTTANALTLNLAIGIGITPDASGGETFLDTRYGVAANFPTGNIVLLTQVAGVGTLIDQVRVTANSVLTYPGPFILGPGGFFVVRGAAANQSATAAFRWYEYSASDGELLNAL